MEMLNYILFFHFNDSLNIVLIKNPSRSDKWIMWDVKIKFS